VSTRARAGDLLLNVALVAAGVLVLALLYSLGTRVLTPRTVPVRAADPLVATEATPDPIQVEVRNASGTDGAAARTMAYLRRRGFDVIEVGNAPLQPLSTVVVRAGTEAYARNVAGALGIDPSQIATEGPHLDYDPDVAVYIGQDISELTPFAGESPADTP
jgi:hypothetical protein